MSVRVAFLLVVMGVLLTVVGVLFGLTGTATAVSVATIASFWSYWSAGPVFIAERGAILCDDFDIVHSATLLAARADIPPPRIYEVDDVHPNALTLGTSSERAIIVLTSALRERLNAAELHAVIAHEIAHIRNRDRFVYTIANVFVLAVGTIGILLSLIGLSSRRRGGGVLIAAGLIFPLSAILLRLLALHAMEYRADRDGALLCGSPRNLISALRKLNTNANYRAGLRSIWEAALAPSQFVVTPHKAGWITALFCSHPSIEKRIAKLEALEAESPHYAAQ